MSSFFAWMGGKSKMAKRLSQLLPEHRCYVEVFAGAANLLFIKDRAKTEVLNDINSELVNLFRVVRHHPREFISEDDVNDTSGKAYPDNTLTLTAQNLPAGLTLMQLQYIDCNEPNGLCATADLVGTLPKGNYKIMFTLTDKKGNDDNAWLGIKIIAEDTTPPRIGCGGLF